MKNFFDEIFEDYELSLRSIIVEYIDWSEAVKKGIPAEVRTKNNLYTGRAFDGMFYYKQGEEVKGVPIKQIKSRIKYSKKPGTINEKGMANRIANNITPIAMKGAINMYRNLVSRKQNGEKKPLIVAAQSFNIDPRKLKDELESMGIVVEGYRKVPSIDRERYTDLSAEGLEGPFRLESGMVVYYDPSEGKYYDRDSDLYLTNDEYMAHNSGKS